MLTTTFIGLGAIGVTLITVFSLEKRGVITVNENIIKISFIIGSSLCVIWLFKTLIATLSIFHF